MCNFAVMEMIRLLRPAQWAKNIFVFLPMFFGGYLLDAAMWLSTVLAFASFCMAASAIYCLNDIIDAPADRKHPVKCRRPVASGMVSPAAAWVLFALLIIGAEAVAFMSFGANDIKVAATVTAYLMLNVAYCFGLKRIAVVDVMAIALGFVLRLAAGGLACGIPLSPWIVLMTFLLTLFLAFAKRRDDVIIRRDTGTVTRKNTRNYSLEFLNMTLGVLAAVTLVCYVMYTVSPEVTERLHCSYVYVSTIFVLAGLLRYMQLAIVDEKSGSPTRILLHDRFIQACCVLWLLFFAAILYL